MHARIVAIANASGRSNLSRGEDCRCGGAAMSMTVITGVSLT
jgi:hypothetical protein